MMTEERKDEKRDKMSGQQRNEERRWIKREGEDKEREDKMEVSKEMKRWIKRR